MATNLPPIPINYLRSIALKNSRTKLIFYVEADFIPSGNLRDITTSLMYYYY